MKILPFRTQILDWWSSAEEGTHNKIFAVNQLGSGKIFDQNRHIDVHVVVGFEDEIHFGTISGDPFEKHDRLEGKI